MTRKEFYAKYGDVEVMFSSYYKFTFNYVAILPNNCRLNVCYGVSNDEIYRHEVFASEPIKIKDLQPYAGWVYDGPNEVDYFYDY